MKKMIGKIMLSAPFVGVFLMGWRIVGFAVTAGVYGGALCLLVWIHIALSLACNETVLVSKGYEPVSVKDR